MKRYRWVLLIALLAAGVGASLLRRAPLSSADLIQSFPFCSPGPVLAPILPLGSCESAPFLGLGWREPDANPYRQTRAREAGSSLRLYLSQPISVEITLEGRLAPSTTSDFLDVDALIQQPARLHLRVPLRVTKEWRRYHVNVADKHLSRGLNAFRIVSSKPTQWRLFRASVSDGGCSFSNEVPASQVVGQELRLPFGQSVAFPVQLTSSSWLNLDGMAPWLLPGAPALAPGSQLQVRIRSGSLSPPLDSSWFLTGVGTQRLQLKAEALQTQALGEAELSLLALPPSRPLPGQAGLSLLRPRVDSWESLDQSRLENDVPVLAKKSRRRPNVILYLIDTLRADHLGCYGYAGATSPQIDRFRQDSVLFANCTAQSGWTKPATASILTSRLPRQHGAMGYADRLHRSSILLSQMLRRAGYETRAVVTNPFVSQNSGFNRGYNDFQLLERAKSEEVNKVAIPWLKSRTERKPFFLYLHTLDPHLPYGKFSNKKCWSLQSASIRRENKEEWKVGEDDKKISAKLHTATEAYDREIMANDESFGKLLQTLKEEGLYDNTIIVLVSDHGEELLDHGRMGHNNSLYQELLHVPLIIKFPKSRAAGTRIEPCWQQIDIAPTILACAGVKPAKSMVGKAYVPGGPPGDPQRPAYISLKTSQSEWQIGEGAKIPRMLHMDAVRKGNWILTRTWVNLESRLEPQELYNLAEDPGQKDNLATSFPEVTVALSDLLLRGLGQEVASAQIKQEDVSRAMRSLHYLR